MNFSLGQTLYSTTKTGNVKTWKCDVRHLDDSEQEAILTIETKTKLDGKSIFREEFFLEGKNIGKSNETTPYQQAVSEAESRYRKKIDQGYRTDIPSDTNKAGDNALGLPKPMLAHPIDKVKELKFPAWIQPKLDGHRAIVTKKDGTMMMYSRQGKPITTMSHILETLEPLVEEGEFLDGELYVHGKALQNIGSLIKRQQPGSEEVEYWIYDDILVDVPYSIRYIHLLNQFEKPTRKSKVNILSACMVSSMDEVMKQFERYLLEGYEGAILRLNGVGYEAGFRSRNLLKIKPFDDNEFKIVDVIEGKDRIVNDTHLKVAVFRCETPDGSTFEVTAPGDMHEKDKAWHHRKELIGKLVTVKHSGYTKDNIPWHPVAMRVREDI